MSLLTMPEPDLTLEQFQAQYGLEPTTVENLKLSQAAYKKRGIEMSLEEVFFLTLLCYMTMNVFVAVSRGVSKYVAKAVPK